MPSCADLDPFFDGELSREAAAGFREHLATCERCQAALRGRMQEEVVAEGAAEHAAPPGILAPRPPRPEGHGRKMVYLAPILVAAAAFVIWFLGTRGAQRAQQATAQLTVAIEHHGDLVRGNVAHVGDVLRPRVRGEGHLAIWVYLDARELVISCPGGAGCSGAGGGLELELRVSAPGQYSIIAIESAPPIVTPHGPLDVMLSKMVAAGGHFKMSLVEVD